MKPDISHLQEFGAPIWILHQGQQHGHKLETLSCQNIFVGFEDGLKSVKYYKHETRKVLISQNYRFLTVTDNPIPTMEGIEIDLLEQHKGELEKETMPDQDAKMDVDVPSIRQKSHQDAKIDNMNIPSAGQLNTKRKIDEDEE